MFVKPLSSIVYSPSLTTQYKFDWVKVFYTDKTALQFELNEEIVGYLAWRLEQNSKVFHISKVEVLPHLHGQGYGKLLIEQIEKFAISLGCNFVDCWCEEEVKLFYEKQGFKDTGYEDFVNDKKIYKLVKKVVS